MMRMARISHEWNIDGCRALANAIIKQGTNDYKVHLRELRKCRDMHNQTARDHLRGIERIEQWIRGPSFAKLTTMNPEYLIEEMRRQWGSG